MSLSLRLSRSLSGDKSLPILLFSTTTVCPGDYIGTVATWLLLGARPFLQKREQLLNLKGKREGKGKVTENGV